MIKNVCMKDCNFAINKEKRTIVCWLNETEDFFNDFLFENCIDGWLSASQRDYKMNNRFVGIAYCAEEDEWNEEFGKRLAFYRMKRKLFDSFYNKVRAYFDARENELDKFEDVCLAYRSKVEASIARQMSKIMESENGNQED